MTARELLELADRQPAVPVAIFVLIPLAAWIWGRLHRPRGGGESPWRYGYAVWVYLACVPGMFAAVLVAYTMFFLHQSLLDVSLGVYVLPILSMAATLFVIKRRVAFDAIPGVERLWGLLLILACSFAIALALDRARLWVVFGGSIAQLLLIAAIVFALLRWGSHLLFKRRKAV